MPKGVHLHARDMQVLEILTTHQVETLDYLHTRLWTDCNRKSAYNRLRALANAGYLEHIKRADPAAPKTWTGARIANEHLYTLGPKAPTAIRMRGRDSTALARRHRRGGIPAAQIDHQLATNRFAEALGVQLMSEEEASAGLPKHARKHRPDGAYKALPDNRGHELVLVEIDLGHYSRDRILEKSRSFINHDDARGLLFVVPTDERRRQVDNWLNEKWGDLFDRFFVLTFDECSDPELLPLELRPVQVPQPVPNDSWWRLVMGEPGCR